MEQVCRNNRAGGSGKRLHMELLKQFRIAVVGHPDSGKSTLIKHLVKALTGRELEPDTLMREVHYSDGSDPDGNPDTRTIKCAKIMFKYGDYEWCFYDAPGHLEYEEQIRQGIEAADVVLTVVNTRNFEPCIDYLEGIMPMLSGKPGWAVYSHSDKLTYPAYDVQQEGEFYKFAKELMENLLTAGKLSGGPHDIELEAIELVKQNVTDKTVMFFSCGKDSAAGLKLMELAGANVDVWFPKSGYDFPEVEAMIPVYQAYFNTTISAFGNSLGRTYENDGVFKMMEAKALANEDFIEANNDFIDTVCVQYRASDEGVRSKDYHISERKNHKRFSPVFYFSESNVWRFLDKYNVPVCSLYFKGFRSMGDAPVTVPCMPESSCIADIVKYIEEHPESKERDGRTGQDKSGEYVMERIRDIGFF